MDDDDDPDCPLTAEQLNPNNWRRSGTSHMASDVRRQYENQCKAINLRLIDGEKINDIELKTGIKARRIHTLIARAKTINPKTGELFGYDVCIPYKRIKDYKRRTIKNSGYAGRMDQFLELTNLTEPVTNLVLGKTKVDGAPARGRFFKKIYKEFRRLSKEAGVDVEHDYPFNTAHKGRDAVRRYADKIRDRHFVDACRVEHGEQAARLAATSGTKEHGPVLPLPYQCVQLDGHPIDTLITMSYLDEHGIEQHKPLARMWVIILLCTSSRAVLGYALSTRFKNYAAVDVINCMVSALDKWEPIKHPNLNPLYDDGAGLPGGVIKQCEGRLFDQLVFDNAYAHYAAQMRDRLMDIGVTEVIYNNPAAPRQNAHIESFMGTLEEYSTHQMPNTTGSYPGDVRRRQPEKEAERLKITYEHLIQLLDVSIANYNNRKHSGINARTPLQYIQYHLNRPNLPPRHMMADSVLELPLYDQDFVVTVRSNRLQGHPPSVTFKNAEYTSDVLRQRDDLNGKKGFLRININDIRQGQLFESNGSFVCDVFADSRWADTPHSLKDRQEICKLIREECIDSVDGDHIGDYVRYLVDEAPNSAPLRNKLVDFLDRQDKFHQSRSRVAETKEIEQVADSSAEDKPNADESSNAISFNKFDFVSLNRGSSK